MHINWWIIGLLLVVPFVAGTATTSVSIANALPEVISITTYSRYNSSTDYFAEGNFTVCADESNTTVFTRIVVEDLNNDVANATLLMQALVNGNSSLLSSFGNTSLLAPYEMDVSGIRKSYLHEVNITDEGSKTTVQITAQGMDTAGAADNETALFTIDVTDCARVENDLNLTENETVIISGNVSTVNVTTTENLTGNIIITEHSESPIDAGSTTQLDNYVTVDITGDIKASALNITLTIDYTAAQVSAKGLSESSLQLLYWNASAWVPLTTTVNTETNQVTVFISGTQLASSMTNLGTFSLSGDPVVTKKKKTTTITPEKKRRRSDSSSRKTFSVPDTLKEDLPLEQFSPLVDKIVNTTRDVKSRSTYALGGKTEVSYEMILFFGLFLLFILFFIHREREEVML